MADTQRPVVIAGGLPAHDLPTVGARPGMVVQAQGLAREQGALVVAWPRWDMAVITPAAPPLGLVAGGLGLLLPPDELVVAPDAAAPIAAALAALLAQPTPEHAAAVQALLARIPTPESALWQVVIAGWAAALEREWALLEQAIGAAETLLARSDLPRAVYGGAALALAVLLLEAGADPAAAHGLATAATERFGALGLTPQAALARWVLAQALERAGQTAPALSAGEQALAEIDPAQAPVVAAVVAAGIAGLRAAHAADGDMQIQARAMHADAAERCPVDTNPLLAARLQAALGDLYLAAARDVDELRAAIVAYGRAEQLFGRGGTAVDSAAVQMSLGSAYQGLGDGGLRSALDAYQRALRVFTLDDYPAEYALLHNNLATVYLKLPMSGERDTMRQALAIQSMQEALKVYTIEDYPHEYAMVQNNLGNAFQYMPSGDRVDKLDRAIEAYHEALRVRSAQRTPAAYATTLSNLANAYANLPAENRGEMLDLAERCYGDALAIFRAERLAEQISTVEQALVALQRERELVPSDASSSQTASALA